MDGRALLVKAVENWPVKVLSVALAIILFVFHRMSGLEERFFSVPLNIEINGDLILASSYPRMIRVTLRGDANSIYPILEDDIVAYADFSKYVDGGTYKASIQVQKMGTALGIESLEINVDPLEITLELDKKTSKNIPLSPSFNGYLENGYELVSYTLTPTQVVVDGPQRIMESLSELSTSAIELGGRSEDFSTTVRVVNQNPLLVIRGDGIAEFRGAIRKLIIIRNFEDVPLSIEGLSPEFSAEGEFSLAAVRFEGSQSELGEYVPEGKLLILDCSGITGPGIYTIPVSLDESCPFTLMEANPAEVTVQVSLNQNPPPVLDLDL